MPQPMPAFSNIPSPQAIGARGLSNLTDVWSNQFLEKGSGDLGFAGFGAQRQADADKAHNQRKEMLNLELQLQRLQGGGGRDGRQVGIDNMFWDLG